MRTAIIVLACLVAVAVAAPPTRNKEQIKSKAREVFAVCQAEHKVTDEIVEAFRKTDTLSHVVPDDSIKCYAKCIQTHFKLLKPDNSYDVDRIVTKVLVLERYEEPVVRRKLEKCNAATTIVHSCEDAWTSALCFDTQ